MKIIQFMVFGLNKMLFINIQAHLEYIYILIDKNIIWNDVNICILIDKNIIWNDVNIYVVIDENIIWNGIHKHWMLFWIYVYLSMTMLYKCYWNIHKPALLVHVLL